MNLLKGLISMLGKNSFPHFDVAICGAGPSGLALSCYLARSGYSVAVLEQSNFPRHQIGEFLHLYFL